jgi:hypothetical protein
MSLWFRRDIPGYAHECNNFAIGIIYRRSIGGVPSPVAGSMEKRRLRFFANRLAAVVYDGEAGASVEEYMEHQTARWQNTSS